MAYQAYYKNILAAGASYILFMDTDEDDDEDYAVTDCQISLSLGESGQCKITVPPSNVICDYLTPYTLWIRIDRDNVTVFEGRLTGMSKDMYNCWDLTFTGALDVLNDIYIAPGNYSNTRTSTEDETDDVYTTVTQEEYVGNLINSYNEQLTTGQTITWGGVVGTTAETVKWEYRYQHNLENYETCMSRILDTVETCGGYLSMNNFTLTVVFPSTTQSQHITFGSNLLDITQTLNQEEFATRIIPLGKKQAADTSSTDDTNQRQLDIRSVNGNVPYVENATAIATYGIITRTVEYSDCESAADLKTLGEEELARVIQPHYQLKVTAVDLKNAGVTTTNFTLGQNVIVDSPAHGFSALAVLVKKLSLNPLKPTQDKMTLDDIIDGYIGKSFSKQKTISNDITTLYSDPDSVKKLRDDVATLKDLVEETQATLIEYDRGFGSRVSTYIGERVTGSYSTYVTQGAWIEYYPQLRNDMSVNLTPTVTALSMQVRMSTTGIPSTTFKVIDRLNTSQYQEFTLAGDESSSYIDISDWTLYGGEFLLLEIEYESGTIPTGATAFSVQFYFNYSYTTSGVDFQDSTLQSISTEIKQTSDNVQVISTDVNGLHDYLTWGDGKLTIMKDGAGIYSEQTNQSFKYKFGTGAATDGTLMEINEQGTDMDVIKCESHLDFRYGGEGVASGIDQWSVRHGAVVNDKMNLNLVYIGGSM